jgi:hypothetical protein
MDDESRAAFNAAWIDPKNNAHITRLARKYALGEDHDDFRQRAYVRLVKSDKTFTAETPFAYFVEAEMRHMRTWTSRSHDFRKTDRTKGDNDETVPESGPRNGERLNVMKQRIARVLERIQKKLGTSPTGVRAYDAVLAWIDGVVGTEELMERLAATRTQVYEARRLAGEAIEAAVALEDKTT